MMNINLSCQSQREGVFALEVYVTLLGFAPSAKKRSLFIICMENQLA